MIKPSSEYSLPIVRQAFASAVFGSKKLPQQQKEAAIRVLCILR